MTDHHQENQDQNSGNSNSSSSQPHPSTFEEAPNHNLKTTTATLEDYNHHHKQKKSHEKPKPVFMLFELWESIKTEVCTSSEYIDFIEEQLGDELSGAHHHYPATERPEPSEILPLMTFPWTPGREIEMLLQELQRQGERQRMRRIAPSSLSLRPATSAMPIQRRVMRDESSGEQEQQNLQQRELAARMDLIRRVLKTKDNVKFILKPNSPANKMIYRTFRTNIRPRFGTDVWARLTKNFTTDRKEKSRVEMIPMYTLPNTSARSHMSYEQWMQLFDIFDCMKLSYHYTGASPILPIDQSTTYEQTLKQMWLNMAYSERITDVATFTSLERVMYSLHLNPQSCYPMRTYSDLLACNQNELVLSAIRGCEQKRIDLENDVRKENDTMPVQESDEPMIISPESPSAQTSSSTSTHFREAIEARSSKKQKHNVILKVFFVLLYFVDRSPGDGNYVDLYASFLFSNYGATIVNQILYILYSMHLGTKGYLFKHNLLALDWLKSHLSESLCSL